VYSFGATSGKLRWSHTTGGFVYGSPAIWHQLVLIGSYDHTFYALDAATGDLRWRFKANGPISGSGTVIDGVVYFATLKGLTYALNAQTGQQLWTFPDGRYTLVVTATPTNGAKPASKSIPIVVDRTLTGLTAAPAAISPNGDGVADTTTFSFTLAQDVPVRVDGRAHASARANDGVRDAEP